MNRQHRFPDLPAIMPGTRIVPAVAASLPPPLVACGDCRHSTLPQNTDPVYGWRNCRLTPKNGGGFARAQRHCAGFALKEEPPAMPA